MKITITGTPGSGKSTVAKILANKLDLKRYYMGQIFRDLAKKQGLTLREYLELGESDAKIDGEIDDYQKKLGESEDDFIIEGRTSFFLIPDSVKVFIRTDLETGAKRILKDIQDKGSDRNEGNFKEVSDMVAELKKRMLTDTHRYKKYYGIDAFDPENFDIVVDSTNLTVDEVVAELLKKIDKIKK